MNKQTAETAAENQWTIIKLIRWATTYLKSHEIDSPRVTGEILLAHALGLNRIDLYLRYDQPLVAAELKKFKTLIKRRVRREPVAYILGVKEFWSVSLEVNADVLIPRPETECLVEAALNLMNRKSCHSPQRILELGTGCGAIVLALASQLPHHHYFASDRSLPAVAVAARNAKRLKLAPNIHFFVADWLTSLKGAKGSFDMIVSNPPYIPTAAIDGLQPEIRRYEPLTALNGNQDGLDSYRKIIRNAHRYLTDGGSLLLEIGHDQQADTRRIADGCRQYKDFQCSKDYSGYDRVVCMRRI